MQNVDLAICARWILPVEPAERVLAHHAVVIHQGRIVAVVPNDDLYTRFAPREIIERRTHVLIPGLVNAHTHAAAVLFRGLAEELTLGDWLRQRIWPLEQRWIDPEFVRDGSELAIAGMLASGTTCFADAYLFPEVTAAAASRWHIRACIGLPVVDAATVWAGSSDEYIAKGLALHDEYRGDPLIATAFAPHAPYTVSDATLGRIRRASDEIELPVTMHLHESAWEIERSLAQHSMRPLERLAQIGLANPLLCAVHMTQLSEADVDLVAARGVSVVHCPQSNLKLATGLAPVRGLLDAGVNVALGTDGAASNNDLDMLDEMRTAALLAKGLSGDASALGPHRVLRMATLNGARALGMGELIGSLEPGKWADVTAVDLASVHVQPVYDPAVALIHSASRENVTDVFVAGRAVVAEGRMLHAGTNELLERTAAWAERIMTERNDSR